MLTNRHLATIRAALLFWQEEMHEPDMMRPYFESEDAEPLTSNEVSDLRRWLANTTVRYALLDQDSGWLADVELFDSIEKVEIAIQHDNQPVAVLVPAA